MTISFCCSHVTVSSMSSQKRRWWNLWRKTWKILVTHRNVVKLSQMMPSTIEILGTMCLWFWSSSTSGIRSQDPERILLLHSQQLSIHFASALSIIQSTEKFKGCHSPCYCPHFTRLYFSTHDYIIISCAYCAYYYQKFITVNFCIIIIPEQSINVISYITHVLGPWHYYSICKPTINT